MIHALGCELPIIAILAAILFPVFARAREKARQASCASNVKQLCLAMLQYAQDYDERLAPGYNVTTGFSGGYMHTPELIYPYVRNAQIYACPSVSNTIGQTFDNGIRCTYGVNQANFSGYPDLANFIFLSQIADPTQTIIWIDDENMWAGPYSPSVPVGFDPNTGVLDSLTDDTGTRASNRHNGTYNCGFADGHVKAMTKTQYRHWSYFAED